MLFQTKEFIIFFSIFFAIYLLISKKWPRFLSFFTLLASYYFYSHGSIYNLPIVLTSTLVNYTLGFYVEDQNNKRRKLVFIVGLLINFAALFSFKYGSRVNSDLIFPLGMSFYTFHAVSYLIDLYRNKQIHRRSIMDFSLYIAFFPQLIAGPMTRGSQFFSTHDNKDISKKNILEGLSIFCFGLVKKVIFADNIDRFLVEPAFVGVLNHSFTDLLMAGVAYNVQVYFDFSGYCDMAIGMALMLGYKLPINFDKPFLARTVTEHWRRWHITLSMWVRDYIFFPLGGSRHGNARKFFNVSVAMLAVAFWHDISMGALYWGMYTLSAMILSYLIQDFLKRKKINYQSPLFFSAFTTILVLSVGRLLYKVSEEEWKILIERMTHVNLQDWVFSINKFSISFILFLIVHHYWSRWDLKQKFFKHYSDLNIFLQLAFALGCIYFLAFKTQSYQNFIYHQF